MDKEQQDLRATAEDMISDSQRVKELERAKLKLDASDPRYAELSRQIEELVAGMAAKAQAQTQLADEAQG